MFQNQAKKTPPPIGTPRNGNVNVDSVGTMFRDLLISRPTAPPEMLNGSDWMNPKKQQSSTNSNSPISVTSLDEIFEANDSKLPKSSFYSAHHTNFSDEKSSSLFSSGI